MHDGVKALTALLDDGDTVDYQFASLIPKISP
jgi:hypothetical protein